MTPAAAVQVKRHGYQLLAPLAPRQYAALKADIQAHGVRVPIEVDEHGQILDGHHRAAIARELKLACPHVVRAGLTEAQKREHVLTVNLLRRHLDGVAWGKAFAMLLKERGVRRGAGQRNDRTSLTVRQVAAEVGVSKATAFRRLRQAAGRARRLKPPAVNLLRALRHETQKTAATQQRITRRGIVPPRTVRRLPEIFQYEQEYAATEQAVQGLQLAALPPQGQEIVVGFVLDHLRSSYAYADRAAFLRVLAAQYTEAAAITDERSWTARYTMGIAL